MKTKPMILILVLMLAFAGVIGCATADEQTTEKQSSIRYLNYVDYGCGVLFFGGTPSTNEFGYNLAGYLYYHPNQSVVTISASTYRGDVSSGYFVVVEPADCNWEVV